jgi:hypothetical protein
MLVEVLFSECLVVAVDIVSEVGVTIGVGPSGEIY